MLMTFQVVSQPDDVENIKKQLCHRFCIKDFGPASTILGIDISYNIAATDLHIIEQTSPAHAPLK